MARYCSQCGRALNEGEVFCPSCGTRIEESKQVANISYQIPNVPTPERKKGTPRIVTAFVISLFLIGVCVYVLNMSSPEKTLNKFEKSYNNMDVDGMMRCLEPNAQAIFKGATALLSGISGYNVNDILSGVVGLADYYTDEASRPKVNFKVKSIDYTTENRAVVHVNYSFYDGQQSDAGSDVIYMVKVNGKWYLAIDLN